MGKTGSVEDASWRLPRLLWRDGPARLSLTSAGARAPYACWARSAGDRPTAEGPDARFPGVSLALDALGAPAYREAGGLALMGDRVEVMRGVHGDREEPFGPLPGFRDANVVAYEFELPERFVPWPGRSRVERTFVLLDVGVSFANPLWSRTTHADGTVVSRDLEGENAWYVDLVSVEQTGGSRYTFRDLYIDVVVPTDGRHYRMLDLDEFGDAVEAGQLSVGEAVDGLRRWQQLLDRYLHDDRWPASMWSDFPPDSIRALAELPSPFAEPVRWNG